MRIGVLCVENITAAKPRLVDKIVLGIAYPCRRKHLGHVLGTLRLHIAFLYGARPDDKTTFTGDMLDGYLIVKRVAGPSVGIRVGGPKDILMGGMV